MAPLSQSYCYQAPFPDDEDEFCQLSAPHSNNLQVPHVQYAGARINMSGVSDSAGCATWAHHQETFADHHYIDQQQDRLPLASDSSILFSTYPERLGISDLVAPDFYAPFRSFNSENQPDRESPLPRHDSCDFWGDCSSSDDHRFKPLYHALQNMNSGIQAKQMPPIDDSSTKVGRYTAEERKDRILRYLKKRNQRNFNKTIKYACRKTLADRRVRVRGRFARNNDSCDEEAAAVKKIETPQQQNDLFFKDDVQIKQDDEDDQWLQEAMATLMYPPYVSGC